jgi:hypothetical protein
MRMTAPGTPYSENANIENANVAQVRIERGALAIGTDGVIGTVEQIIVDHENGQLLAVVIRGRDSATEFELPAGHVTNATGAHVYLDVSNQDVATRPDLARPYDPEHYLPVREGNPISAGEASRVAARTDQPVVTEVEPDAAELVAPERSGAPSDLPPATGSAPAPEPSAGLRPEPSLDPSTTGELIGGKPTTSGMGNTSSVPASPVPALDTVPVTPNQPPAGPEPPTPPAEAREPIPAPPPVPPLAPPAAHHPTPVVPPPHDAPSPMPTPDLEAGGPRDHESLAGLLTTDPLGTVRRLRVPTSLLFAAGGLGIATVTGLFLRRRAAATRPAGAAQQVQTGLQGAAQQAREVLRSTPTQASRTSRRALEQTSEAAGQARRQARRATRRTVRRARWFRRGLLAGSVLAILFAPKPGEELREQIADLIDDWRARVA